MTPELSKKLLDRYDYIFRDSETGEFTGLMGYGFACEDGWYNILDCLFEELCAEVVGLSLDEMHTRREIDKVKAFLKAPRMSDSQAEKREALFKKARKAELSGDSETASECLLSVQMLDEALQRLIDEELRRHEMLENQLEKLEMQIAGAKSKAPKISQIKEKFATLRVYGSIPEHKQSAVNMAEKLSGRTCEKCGAPGNRVIIGYLHSTLCMPHANEKAQGRPMQIFGLDRP